MNQSFVYDAEADLKIEIRYYRVVKTASYLIGVPMKHVEVIYRKRAMKRMANTMRDDHHPTNQLYETLPSGRRLKCYKGTDRFLNTFYP